MTSNEVDDDTQVSDWDDTDDLSDDAYEERERLRVNLELAEGDRYPLIDGRYQIIERHGQGGMGVVFHARDLHLDRDVALKLVRSRLFKDEDRLRERLEREAKALARLDGRDHIVGVYDVGRHDDRIYFTMPYIDGVNLREWQDAEPRTVSQLLDVYLQAARGLAAVHELGIVHRDFKPANVLVRASDQRAFVADFGIADAIGAIDAPTGESPNPLIDARLTNTGVVLGTLPYVAPERLLTDEHAPLPSSPASDQFSFCVALWEALAEQLPFVAKSASELLTAIERGPQGAGRIPAWLLPVLRRGLAREPQARFASMLELVRAIERRRRRRRLLMVGGIVLVMVLLAAATAWGYMRVEYPCDFAARAARVWGEPQKQALLEARELAPETMAEVEAQLDALMDRWVRDGEGLCVAGYVPPEQPKVQCLHNWLGSAERSIELLRTIDDEATAARAGMVTSGLWLQGEDYCVFSPPCTVEPEVWLAAEKARAAALLGDDEQALRLADDTVAGAQLQAGETLATPNLAEAYMARAEVHARAQRYEHALHDFEEAYVAAANSDCHDLDISNQALWAKVRALAAKQPFDYEDALDDLRLKRRVKEHFLETVLDRDLARRLEAELADAIGFVESERGESDAAIESHEDALAILADAEQPVLRAKLLNNLGRAYHDLGKYDDARQTYHRARAVLVGAGVPPQHEISIDVEFNLGALEADAERNVPAALDHLDRVIKFGSEPTRVDARVDALTEALDLAIEAGDEARMLEYANQVVQTSMASVDAERRITATFSAAAALVILGDPRGDQIFADLDAIDPTLVSEAVIVDMRKAHVVALERSERCADAAIMLAKLSDFVQTRALDDEALHAWGLHRKQAKCHLTLP